MGPSEREYLEGDYPDAEKEDAIVRQSELSRHLAELGYNITEICQHIKELKEMLAPMLKPAIPDDPSMSGENTETQSKRVEEVKELQRKVGGCRVLLKEIQNRLEV